jgi:hypothetical protein
VHCSRLNLTKIKRLLLLQGSTTLKVLPLNLNCSRHCSNVHEEHKEADKLAKKDNGKILEEEFPSEPHEFARSSPY